jgi:hypothetical protein
VTVARELVSMNVTDAWSVVQPERDPGISAQPVTHDAAVDWIRTSEAFKGTAFRIATTLENI